MDLLYKGMECNCFVIFGVEELKMIAGKVICIPAAQAYSLYIQLNFLQGGLA